MKYKIQLLCAGALLSILFVPMVFGGNKNPEAIFRLIQGYHEYPYSLDPLDADITSNMDLVKLRYLTPIEVDHTDKFRSTILNRYDFDPAQSTMTWEVREDLKFSDGSRIASADVVLAIKRMALKRPGFPVLGSIKGLQEWAQKKDALKQDIPGISVSKNTIKISFNRKIKNPYFQFTLPIFAIQPARCFDLSTSKNICDIPPASGFYDFDEGETPDLNQKTNKYIPIKLRLREGFNFVGNYKMPPRITLEYKSEKLAEIVKILDEYSVAKVSDSRLSDEFINQFRNELDIQRLPKTAIWYLMLNPKYEAFRDKDCRRIFANKYRNVYERHVKNKKRSFKSFSSPMMPGYLTNEEIDRRIPTPHTEQCQDVFKKFPITYLRTSAFWDNILSDTMDELGMPKTGFLDGDKSVSIWFKNFEQDKTSVVTGYVNFWPLDLPSGFRMFFTPGMHEDLKHLLKSGVLTNLAEKLFSETDSKKAESYFEKINLELYEDAQLNAFSYFGNAYISKVSKTKRLPIATSEPNPWHLFIVK